VSLDYDNLNCVNLSGTDMTGAYISWSTFTGTNLTGANLSGAFFMPADFTKANLTGADLFGADLDGVTWTDATCPDGTNASSHSVSCAGATTFRFGGFIAPKPGSTVAVSAKHITAGFKLTTASGTAIPASTATAIGAAKQVRATLAGPGIKATSTYCSWNTSAKEFVCTIPGPSGIEKGKSHSYTITVTEKPSTSFATAPRLGAMTAVLRRNG
jgi:hypothetical protein